MEESDYSVYFEDFGSHKVIKFKNYSKIDLYNSRELVEVFNNLNAQGKYDTVLDMSGIEYIDSSGLGVLANQGMLLSKMQKRLKLIKVGSGISHLFKASGFDRIFGVFPDLEFLHH